MYHHFRIIFRLAFQDTVNVSFLQQHIVIPVDTGNDIVIHGDDTLFHGIAIVQTWASTPHQQKIRCKSANVNPYSLGDLPDFFSLDHHSGIRLGIYSYVPDAGMVGSSVIHQILHLSVSQEILPIPLRQFSVMLGRTPIGSDTCTTIFFRYLTGTLQFLCNSKLSSGWKNAHPAVLSL